MGYTTKFTGRVTVTPPLNQAEISYLRQFAQSRRMNRSKGPYFVKGSGFRGQESDDDVIDYDEPDPSQPGLWCQWVPTVDGTAIEWDGGEKFYNGAEWMACLIDHFLRPGAHAVGSVADRRLRSFTFDHTVNGVIHAQGGEPDDTWRIEVHDNVVTTHEQ